jgi:serine/threonine-protein kinase
MSVKIASIGSSAKSDFCRAESDTFEMESRRRQLIEELLHSALEHPETQRASFLEAACGDDRELRREVESMLAHESAAADFLEVPAIVAVNGVVTSGEATATHTDPFTEEIIGRRFSHYRVLEKLGGGGMGVVYKGEDVRLGRPVALKFLLGPISRDREALARFRREARAASSLSHPNICTVFDIGEAEGRPFIVMELLQGRTLKHHIHGKPMPTDEVVVLGQEMAGALEAAHAKGIIHRDVKPSNVFITDHGQAKILDFGVAKLSAAAEPIDLISATTAGRSDDETTLTQPGMAVGTPSYMSPEQASGQQVDVRSDLFSLGAVLYEMATGELAFPKSFVWTPPPAMPTLDGALHRIVLKLLRTDPEQRYQTAADFLEDVKRLKASASTVGQRTMLAVLPLENLSSDEEQEYFSEGLTEEMLTQLGRMNPERLGVIARTSVMRYKHACKSIQEIGLELGVSYVLAGSVRRAGRRVRIAIQLIQVNDETHLWAESYERDFADLLALQRDVAHAVAREIRLNLTPQARARLTTARLVNADAYEAYLRGRFFWNKRTKDALEKAAGYFQKSIEKDPDYAPAYAGLADSYYVLAGTAYSGVAPRDAYSKAKAATLRALQIDDTLAEAHTSLAHFHLYELDWLAAERDYQRSIELNAAYATAHHWYALLLSALCRFPEALIEAECARQLDPLSLIINRDVGLIYYYARQPERAIQQYRATLELDPNFASAHQALGRAYLAKDMTDEAIAEIRKAVRLSGRSVTMRAALAHACAATGNRREATKILRELMERAQEAHVPSTTIAVVYSGLGDKDKAFEWLERAYNEHDSGLHTLQVHPIFDSLRSDQRFQNLLRRLNLTR